MTKEGVGGQGDVEAVLLGPYPWERWKEWGVRDWYIGALIDAAHFSVDNLQADWTFHKKSALLIYDKLRMANN